MCSKLRIHDATRFHRGCTTGFIVYTDIFLVVQPVVQPVVQRVASCIRGFKFELFEAVLIMNRHYTQREIYRQQTDRQIDNKWLNTKVWLNAFCLFFM